MSWYLISPSRLRLSGSYSQVESFRGVALVIVSCDHVIDCFHEVVNLLSASSSSLVLKHTVSTTTLRHRGSRLDLLINGLTSKNISMSKNHHCGVFRASLLNSFVRLLSRAESAPDILPSFITITKACGPGLAWAIDSVMISWYF